MNRTRSFLLFMLSVHPALYAQHTVTMAEPHLHATDSLHTAQEDSLKISPEVMNQVFRIFEPQAAPMSPDDRLTVEQLHEWVGTPDAKVKDSVGHCKYDSMYFALKLYERELGTIYDLPQFSISCYRRDSVYKRRAAVSFDAVHAINYVFFKGYRDIQKGRRIKEAHAALWKDELY